MNEEAASARYTERAACRSPAVDARPERSRSSRSPPAGSSAAAMARPRSSVKPKRIGRGDHREIASRCARAAGERIWRIGLIMPFVRMVGIIAPQYDFSCRRCSNRLGRSRKKVINYLGEDLGFDAMQRLTHSPSPLVYIRRERDQFRPAIAAAPERIRSTFLRCRKRRQRRSECYQTISKRVCRPVARPRGDL